MNMCLFALHAFACFQVVLHSARSKDLVICPDYYFPCYGTYLTDHTSSENMTVHPSYRATWTPQQMVAIPVHQMVTRIIYSPLYIQMTPPNTAP